MKNILIFLVVLAWGMGLRAQTGAPAFQYTFNPFYVNPAAAGSDDRTLLHSFYRSRLSHNDWGPSALGLSVDAPAVGGRNGLGFLLHHGQTENQKVTSATGSYAIKLPIAEGEGSHIAIGVGLGISHIVSDTVNRIPEDHAYTQFNTRQEILGPDARAGIFYTNKHFFAGLSVQNLLSPLTENVLGADPVVPLPALQYNLLAGAKLRLYESLEFRPAVLYTHDKLSSGTVNVSASALIKNFQVGTFYRSALQRKEPREVVSRNFDNQHAVGFFTGIKATQNLMLGYSLDYPLSNTNGPTFNAHDLSLRIMLSKGKNNYVKGYASEFPF